MSTPLNPMSAIEARAKALADTRAVLTEIVTALNDGIEALHREHMTGLKRAVTAAAEQHDRLSALIEQHPELFSKPRTVVMHGIKVGFKKAKGSIDFEDGDAVVRRIEKLFPEQADLLVITEKKPSKDALAQLPAADLKKLGVTMQDTGDAVVIAPVDSQVDKLVRALVKAAVSDADEG